jgi:hypothetical protein
MITPPQTLLLILGHQPTLVSCTSQIPLLWLVQESPTGLKTRLPHFLAIPVLHSISRHHILLFIGILVTHFTLMERQWVSICHKVNLLIGLKDTRDRRALSAFRCTATGTTLTDTPRRMLPYPYANRLCVCGTRSDSPNSRVTLTRGPPTRAPPVCIMQPAATLVNSVHTKKKKKRKRK